LSYHGIVTNQQLSMLNDFSNLKINDKVYYQRGFQVVRSKVQKVFKKYIVIDNVKFNFYGSEMPYQRNGWMLLADSDTTRAKYRQSLIAEQHSQIIKIISAPHGLSIQQISYIYDYLAKEGLVRAVDS
jgi:hypothetical protein